jgi:hypothetical protein
MKEGKMAPESFFIWNREQPFENARFVEDKSLDSASPGFGIISPGLGFVSPGFGEIST